MYEFKLPDIGEGLSEGELVEWLVAEGDVVAEGADIVNVSTDKVVVTLNAPCAGRVVRLAATPGTVVPVGGLLMVIDDTGRNLGGPAPGAAEGHAAPPQPASGATDAPAARPPTVSATAGAVRASPAARRYAHDRGTDVAAVAAGLGVSQVGMAEIDRFLSGADRPDVSDDAPAVKRQRLFGPRLAAAQRLALAASTAATSVMTIEVNADRILAAAGGPGAAAPGPGPLAVIARCVMDALAKHGSLNATIDEQAQELVLSRAVHLGVAVDSPNGLLVPVLRDADRLDTAGLAAGIRDLAGRARRGELSAADFRDSTFTLSSTGGLESAAFVSTAPILNYPDVATLWVSRIRDRPRVVGGELGVGPVMHCSLAFDHRHLHGADIISFLNDLDASFRGEVVQPRQG
jgi:pyruvate/2-oxoglutarate dehydrogenase complex dihydrolipoamide acyltransferase (E2) component